MGSGQIIAVLDNVSEFFKHKHTIIRPRRSLRVKLYANDRFGFMLNSFYGLIIGIVKPSSKICSSVGSTNLFHSHDFDSLCK